MLPALYLGTISISCTGILQCQDNRGIVGMLGIVFTAVEHRLGVDLPVIGQKSNALFLLDHKFSSLIIKQPR